MQVQCDGFREARQNQPRIGDIVETNRGGDEVRVINLLSESDLRATGRRECASVVYLPQIIENK